MSESYSCFTVKSLKTGLLEAGNISQTSFTMAAVVLSDFIYIWAFQMYLPFLYITCTIISLKWRRQQVKIKEEKSMDAVPILLSSLT